MIKNTDWCKIIKTSKGLVLCYIEGDKTPEKYVLHQMVLIEDDQWTLDISLRNISEKEIFDLYNKMNKKDALAVIEQATILYEQEATTKELDAFDYDSI